MVFCGRPSKACERCRVRRLKCDLHSGACGQCVRAARPCSGYRDTQQLRIRIESQTVARRALRSLSRSSPQSLPLSIGLQARDAFFAYYLDSKCWDFLKPYHHPADAPEHLTLAIEAVSLAYLWHQVYSDTALAAAREKYVLALRMTKRKLDSCNGSDAITALMTSLLLDLFEKITDNQPRNMSWASHVNGALALVHSRGLEQFQEHFDFNILIRFITHYIISCIASEFPPPETINAIQAYVEIRLHVHSPVLRFTNLTVQYAILRSKLSSGLLSDHECIQMCTEVDRNIQALALNLPPSWQYSTIILEYTRDRMFGIHYDSYSNSKVCQALNVLRVLRILLNQSLLGYYLASPASHERSDLTGRAHENIQKLGVEICASVPQYVDCPNAARHRLPPSERSPDGIPSHSHTHTPDHQLVCYTLIFPLYIAGRSGTISRIKPWVIGELHYIGSHFCIRNAELAAQMLEREEDIKPWEVYAMLGSYAFAS